MSYEMQWIDRIYELMDRLAKELTKQGVASNADETLTVLVDKANTVMSNLNNNLTIAQARVDELETANAEFVQKVYDEEYFRSDGFTDYNSYYRNYKGQELIFPPRYTANAKTFSYMFEKCTKLLYIPELDTSNGENFFQTFMDCNSISQLPNWDFSKGTNFHQTFQGCRNVINVGTLDLTSATNIAYLFQACTGLKTIECLKIENNPTLTGMFNACTELTDVHFEGTIGKSLSFASCSKLSVESILGVFEALADLTGQTAQTLTLGATNLAKLSEEQIAIATNKNWTLA